VQQYIQELLGSDSGQYRLHFFVILLSYDTALSKGAIIHFPQYTFSFHLPNLFPIYSPDMMARITQLSDYSNDRKAYLRLHHQKRQREIAASTNPLHEQITLANTGSNEIRNKLANNSTFLKLLPSTVWL
jgi:hypothetical protein